MTSSTVQDANKTMKGPQRGAIIGQLWGKISPSLVPVLAVLTALIATIPLMVITGGQGNLGRGLNIAGTAYAALIEGALGLAVNDIVTPDNLSILRTFAEQDALSSGDLRRLSRSLTDVSSVGDENARRISAAIAPYSELSDDEIDQLSENVGDIQAIGVEQLELVRPLAEAMYEMERGPARTLAQTYAALESLTEEDRAAIEAQVPVAATYEDDNALLTALRLVNEWSVVGLDRILTQWDALATENFDINSPEAYDIASIITYTNGARAIRSAAETVARLDAQGVTDIPAFSEQVALVRALYEREAIDAEDVATAINTQLPGYIEQNLVVRRPGNRLTIAAGTDPSGIVYTTPQQLSTATSSTGSQDAGVEVATAETDLVPSFAYLRLGGSALIFFPANLEEMLLRAMPFIIAGLAVAVAFKGGMFNIGAEGQLYAGSILAIWVGFAFPDFFATLPSFVHIVAVIIAGLIGGFLWGAIPGFLKAFTGAHEVITTIMLNYIMIRLVDWLIKTEGLLLDPGASTPRTPFINATAVLPRFNTIPDWLFFAVGIVIALLGLYSNRRRLSNLGAILKPILTGVAVIVIGLFLSWITVANRLNIGFVIMVLAVWVTQWFFTRTTVGFEITTVGTNPDAAKYSGMSVRWNIILAMALSGMLAGLAGTIEITGKQFYMQPAFFAGLGFEAIAVSLLAASKPRNMIWAGLVWGCLLTGAGLMQVRADIAIDLVKIVQALIIMFIAADAIIRYIWRIPNSSEKGFSLFTKGMGG